MTEKKKACMMYIVDEKYKIIEKTLTQLSSAMDLYGLWTLTEPAGIWHELTFYLIVYKLAE